MISGGAEGQAREDRGGSLLIEGVGIQAVAHTGGFAVQVLFSGCFVREKPELGFDAKRSTVQKDSVSSASGTGTRLLVPPSKWQII